jgi:phospho-N-acetylmuramoyl-pentapeptide-transferase
VVITGIITFLFSFIGVLLVIIISKRENAFQPIHELAPEGHKQKAKTPTMGGIAFLLAICTAPAIFSSMTGYAVGLEIWWLILVLNVNFFIGLIDDLLSLSSKKNKGLSAKAKFRLQWIVAGALVILAHFFLFSLHPFEILVYSFLMVASSNACNLTDGLDGLLGGSVVISLLGFSLIFLYTTPLPSVAQFTIFAMCAVAGFLLLNLPKAKCFMGDSGSLQLGALLAGLTLLSQNPYLLLGLGVVYVIETASVIIQVTSFKLTGKRIFLMSPLHHHFELMGLSERSIIVIFYAFGLLGLIITMGFYGPF